MDRIDKGSFILVESPIDALTLEQNGFHAIATYGANIPSHSLERFKDKNVYILFDKDNSGRIGATKASRLLLNVTDNVHVIEFPQKVVEKIDVNSYLCE